MRKLVLPLLAGALALAGCDSDTTAPSGEARVSVLLTDAPGDFVSAVVTITDVYFQGAGGGQESRVYLREGNPITTDLLTLSNDVLEIVDRTTVPAGNYGQLRFVLTGAYVELENADGSTSIYATSSDYAGLPVGATVDGELKCPSCSQSGFKVNLHNAMGQNVEGLQLEGDQTLLVDFDVSDSFIHEAGNSGKWVLRPTLKATSVQYAASIDVTLAVGDGVELPIIDEEELSLGEFEATLTPVGGGDAKIVTLTDANDDGVWVASFVYLFPGDYRIDFLAPEGVTFDTDRALPVTVTVGQGARVTEAFVLTAAGTES